MSDAYTQKELDELRAAAASIYAAMDFFSNSPLTQMTGIRLKLDAALENGEMTGDEHTAALETLQEWTSQKIHESLSSAKSKVTNQAINQLHRQFITDKISFDSFNSDPVRIRDRWEEFNRMVYKND